MVNLYTLAMNIPVETTEEIDHRSITVMPGRRWVMASLVFAALAPVIVPVVFGPLGVAAGVVAAAKGARWWGTAGVSASLVAAVTAFRVAARLTT